MDDLVVEGERIFRQVLATLLLPRKFQPLYVDHTYGNHNEYVVPYAFVSSGAHFYIYESPTIGSATGTLTAYNRNRNSSNTTGATVQYFDESDAGNVTGGTLIYHENLGAGKGVANATGARDEIILRQNTGYAFILENEGAAANIHNIVLNWYEHTNKAI